MLTLQLASSPRRGLSTRVAPPSRLCLPCKLRTAVTYAMYVWEPSTLRTDCATIVLITMPCGHTQATQGCAKYTFFIQRKQCALKSAARHNETINGDATSASIIRK